jgi:hypothetical protein
VRPLESGDPARLGRFELLGRIGEGGQGIVHLGRGTGPGEERVAVKVLRSVADATVLQRLARELEAIHQVQPFVTAGVIEATVEGDRRFIVSEFIDGPSLEDRVAAQGPLRGGDLQRLAVGTATALTAVHGAGVVHRDFKPANVLLGPDGPRVVDFGIARITDATTITSGLIGTPSYIAPEQLAGERPASAVDIFAWALTMIYAATGRLGFSGDTVQAVIYRILYEEPDLSGLPPSLLPVIQQCLSKDPRQRPTARDLLLRLVDPSLQAGFPGSGPSPNPVQVSRAEPLTPVPGRSGPLIGSRVRSGRKLFLAAGGGVAALVLVAGAGLYLTRGSPSAHAGSGSTAGAKVTDSSAAARTPAAFAGTWVSIDGPGTFIFTAGARVATENMRGCVGNLILKQVREAGAILVFTLPASRGCSPGSVWCTLIGGTLIDYQWQNAAGKAADTQLRKA